MPVRCRHGAAAGRSGVDDIFLLNPAVRDSLDGRYFGPLLASNVLGRATPILTRDAPGGPLRWRITSSNILRPKRKG